jgi:hypothetical protein
MKVFYVLSTIGMESYGRIGDGIAELIASILILTQRISLRGAMIGFGVIIGTVLLYLFLGIEVQNNGGVLFILAVITFLCCSALVYHNKN